jgi:hypothetical protein
MKYFKIYFLILSLVSCKIALAQPVITNVTPASGSTVKWGSTINFSATVTDANTVIDVAFILPGGYDYINFSPLSFGTALGTKSGNLLGLKNSIFIIKKIYDAVGPIDTIVIFFTNKLP